MLKLAEQGCVKRGGGRKRQKLRQKSIIKNRLFEIYGPKMIAGTAIEAEQYIGTLPFEADL